MTSKPKILDFLIHGGHQYEFFKNNADFYCLGVNGEIHTSKSLGRPQQNNVNFISKNYLSNFDPDIVMIRAGVNHENLYKFIKNGAKAIAVVQTHTPFKIPEWCKIVVWNSKVSMDKYKKFLTGKQHYYIVHGFDPNEFKPLNIEKKERILSSYSLFKQRGDFLGYDNWKKINDQINLCDVIGHGNEEIKNNIGIFSYPQLIEIYNSYSGYLNTSIHSAMPRSRAEAMMCGLPIITTSNYDTPFYFKDRINSLIANDPGSMIKLIRLLLSNSKMQEDLSLAGRETAIKYFNIKTYLERWKNILI